MGKIDVQMRDGVIVVTMSGRLSSELVAGMRKDLLPLLKDAGEVRILYDSRQVELRDDQSVVKALETFDQEIQPKVHKIASLTADYSIAARVGQIHVYSKNHERFYDEKDAWEWLRMD
jgi:SpoIIAA-like